MGAISCKMTKHWWKEAVVYQIYPRSFNDSNGDGIGDIQGIIQKLPYLEKLGIDAVWLSPIYKSPNIDYGYDVADYYEINPEYGNMTDFEELVAKAKKHQIKIIMDLVLNHTSSEHKWFKEAKKGTDNPYHDYYIWRKPEQIKAQLEHEWTRNQWTFVPELGQYYFHLFDYRQPDLNWNNPQMRQELYKMMNFWVERGVGGFRLDVIDLIGKDPDHGITVNGPNLHPYLKEMYEAVFAGKDLLTVGETWSAGIKEAKQYTYENSHELTIVFEFQPLLLSQKRGMDKWHPVRINPQLLKKVLLNWQTKLDYEQGWNTLFWSNHDLARTASLLKTNDRHRIAAQKMLVGLQFFLKGTPFIYQGDELGMTNVNFSKIEMLRDPESIDLVKKSDDKKTALRLVSQKGRDNARTPMQWNNSSQAGFTTGKSWIDINPNFLQMNAQIEEADPNSIFNFYRKLIAIKKHSSTLKYGDFVEICDVPAEVLAFIRSDETGSYRVFANLSRKAKRINYHISRKKVVVQNYPIKETGATYLLKPYELLVEKTYN